MKRKIIKYAAENNNRAAESLEWMRDLSGTGEKQRWLLQLWKHQRSLTAGWEGDGQSWRNESTDGSLKSCCWKGLINGAIITCSYCPMRLIYISYLFIMYFLTDAANTLVRLKVRKNTVDCNSRDHTTKWNLHEPYLHVRCFQMCQDTIQHAHEKMTVTCKS